MPYHNSPADPGIKKAMMGGHSQSVKANYSGSKPQGDKFASSIGSYGFKIIPDNGANAVSYGPRKVASSPMMKTPRKSWRSGGSRSRSSRSEPGGMYG